jgi:23S rRNA (cytidine2498-2'-O)-methyltransferase
VVCCQQGAQSAVKQEVQEGWRLAFSRPGFVTFKHDGSTEEILLPQGTFVRYAGWNLGNVKAIEFDQALDQLEQLLPQETFDQLHLWQRDRAPVGRFDFEPFPTEETKDLAARAFSRLSAKGRVMGPAPNHSASPGDRVLDIVLVDGMEPPSLASRETSVEKTSRKAQQWWVAWHVAVKHELSTSWPGGVPPLTVPSSMVSRTYLKTAEALAWSGFPIREGDQFVELGSAPGGSVQRLLELGMRVLGIDPALMDERVQNQPNFTHLRARGGDLKRSVYRNCRWMIVDSNVQPDKSLTTVEHIVLHRNVKPKGLLLTMKLKDYGMASMIPTWVERIRNWGYAKIKVRQLAFCRTEVCIAAKLL